MNGINEHNLRELAYQIWEAEGRPPGQAERHWQMALEQAGLQQEAYTTGESFLGETITSENLVQDERQYATQNNPFADEITQTTMEAEGMNTPQQPLDTQLPVKGGKRKSSKNKTNDTFASQDTGASPRKSGKRKSSENILV
jgi:Protein of unknown function (DUF2934).